MNAEFSMCVEVKSEMERPERLERLKEGRIRMGHRALLSLPSLLIFLAIVPSVSACQCPETSAPPTCALFWRSQIVMTALVTRVNQAPDSFGRYPEGTLVHLSVKRLYKGRVGKHVTDIQGQEGNCKTIYRVGRQYLIFASGYEEQSNLLKTDLCNGTAEVSHAMKELDHIKKLAGKLTLPSLQGKVLKGRYEPLGQVKILIEGMGKKYEAITNNEGKYKMELAEPGQYNVTVIGKFAGGRFSYGQDEGTLKSNGIHYLVVLGRGQCDYREVTVFGLD